MSGVQEKEGEFKKRIWELLSDANIGLPYNSEEYPHGTYMDGVKSNDLFKILEDAKKEFPNVDEMKFKVVGINGWPPEDPSLTTDWNSFLKTLDGWFKKWFGT